MSSTEIKRENHSKNEILFTGGSALLMFVILLAVISILWAAGIVNTAREHHREELRSIGYSLGVLMSDAEAHVYQMKAHVEREQVGGTHLKLIGNAPFDSNPSIPFALYQYSPVKSDTSVCIEEALSLMDIAYSAHRIDSTFQWSYFYDAEETYTVFYPKATTKEDMVATNTSTPDSMLAAIFSADGTYPVTAVSPENNPEGTIQWTTPYTDAGGAGMMVSILAPVFQNNRFVGAVGTDITLEKIRSFITSKTTEIMHLKLTDESGATIATTCSCEANQKRSYRFSENIEVNGWNLTAYIKWSAFVSSITSDLIMPLIIVLISLIAFAILEILFLRQFVYPSLELSELEKKRQPPTVRSFLWTAFVYILLFVIFATLWFLFPHHQEQFVIYEVITEGALLVLSLLTFTLFQFYTGKVQNYYFGSLSFLFFSFAALIDMADEVVAIPLWLDYTDDLLQLLGFTLLFTGAWNITKQTRKTMTDLSNEASTDHLTGVYNRLSIDKLFTQIHESCKKNSSHYTVMMIDIDYFKKVNDTFGHAVGDVTLQKVSAIIASELRERDVIGRYGGEEFVAIILEQNLEIAQSVAERIREAVESKCKSDEAAVTISVGVSSCDPVTMTSMQAVHNADKSLYKAKEQGRNRVVIHREEV